MEARLKQFGLELAPEKTQCIEFGRFAEKKAKARGEKAKIFDFLGFTHYCCQWPKKVYQFRPSKVSHFLRFNLILHMLNHAYPPMLFTS